MICPFCGTHIEDGLDVCPACHADLTAVAHVSHPDRRYCASCGALIPEGSDVCPQCGMPCIADEADADDGEEVTCEGAHVKEAPETPRIISAIPTADGPFSATSANERLPRRRVFTLAFVAALVFVGGGILAITQPWNPNAYSIKATTAADTSKAGYPGEIDKLAGQDTGIDTSDVESGDAQTYEAISGYWEQLGDIRKSLEESETALKADVQDSSKDISTDYQTAKQNALDLSNLISDIGDVDVSTGTYADDVTNLQTLGSWLRNWSDGLMEAWDRAQSGSYKSADTILAPLSSSESTDGSNSYAQLFDQSYDEWQPQEK